MTVVTPKFGVGASVLRVEDHAFITGRGRYTDDIQPQGLLHGFVLRSPHAKARFTILSTEAAKAAPGVHLVLTSDDVKHIGDLKSVVMQKQPDGTRAPTRDIPVLCRGQVSYVGDAVAFVVADTRALAQDAAELIEIDYEPEAAATATATALDPGTPLVWPERGTNRAFLNQIGDRGKCDAAFAAAAHVVRIGFHNNRLVCNYMEPRGAIAEWKADEDRFVLTERVPPMHWILGREKGYRIFLRLVRAMALQPDGSAEVRVLPADLAEASDVSRGTIRNLLAGCQQQGWMEYRAARHTVRLHPEFVDMALLWIALELVWMHGLACAAWHRAPCRCAPAMSCSWCIPRTRPRCSSTCRRH